MKQLVITALYLGMICLCQLVNAQRITVNGQVTDSLNNPLELSNVIAINPRTKAITSYAITDSEGRYKLLLNRDSLYLLKASYLGYQPWEKTIRPGGDMMQQIILKPAPDQLDEVELVQELPVSISGDTITYRTDAFTTGKERKLEQVLEQLPGFEVDDDGQIKVQGKDVSKVLVEGKEFFDGDTKMATKNIPANAVDKVQVLRDFNEIGPLSGVSDSDDLALNIKLKEGKKNLWFGDLSAGLGPEERYIAHPNVFYYSPKMSVNFIGDLNNIGEQAFTLQDYFRFNGGLASLGRRAGSSINLSGDDVGLSLLQNNRAENIVSRLAALNFSYKPSGKINFGGFGILSATDTDIASGADRTYIREDGNNREQLSSNTLQKNTALLIKLSATYTPNAKWHVNFDGFIKGSKITDNNNFTSDFGTVVNDITSVNSRVPFSIEQNFSAFYARDNNNIFSVESNHLYKEQRPEYSLQTTLQPFLGNIPLAGTSPFGLFQSETIQTNKLDSEFNYYRILNKTNHISFSMGAILNGQRLLSGLEEYFQDGSSQIIEDTRFNNRSSFDFLDIYFGIGYRIKLGKLSLSPGLSFHIYDTENTQHGEIYTLDKTLLLPKLRAKYEFNSSQSLRFNYALQAEFTDIQNFAPALQLTGYNSLFEGNANLSNAWYHSFSLNYFNYSIFNFTNINGGLNYQKRYNDIGTAFVYQGLDVLASPVNLSLPNETFSGYGQYQRKFPYWQASLKATIAYGKNNNLVDALPNFNRSFTQNYRVAFETRFKEAPNLEIGFEKIWNDYSSNSIANNFVTNRPFANIEAYFLKHFSITADYQYNAYKNRNGQTGSYYDFFNASLFYKHKASRWEFILSGLNLLNTTSIRQDSFTDNLIGTYEYFVQPRYFVFSIKYEL